MRTHTHAYNSIAQQKLESEKETQEAPIVQVKPTTRQQSIPNSAAFRRMRRDTVLSSTLDFENL